MEIVNNNIGFICASEAREKSNQRKEQLKQQAIERIENERKDLVSMVYSEIATAIAQGKYEAWSKFCLTAIEFEELKFYFESKGFNIEVKDSEYPPKYLLQITW